MASTSSLSSKDKDDFHWISDLGKMKHLPSSFSRGLMNCIPCKNFEKWLLDMSGLLPTSHDYNILEFILFDFLNFRIENAHGMVGTRENDRKFPAIVAGSFPAYLGKTVKKFEDIDVFVIVTEASLKHFAPLWSSIIQAHHMRSNSFDEALLAYYKHEFQQILWVENFGKVQIILKFHPQACLCDHHINAEIFKQFHHCSRWRLHVYEDHFMARYMHLEGGKRGNVICESSAITLSYDNAKNLSKSYPTKHLHNVLDFGPPTLAQQALHVTLRKQIVPSSQIILKRKANSSELDDKEKAKRTKLYRDYQEQNDSSYLICSIENGDWDEDMEVLCTDFSKS